MSKKISILSFIFFFLLKTSIFYAQMDVNTAKAYALLTIAQEKERQAGEELDNIKTRRIQIEENLIDAQENPSNISKNEKRALEDELKKIKKTEKDYQKKREDAKKYVSQVTDIIKANPKKREGFIKEYEKKSGAIDYSQYVVNEPAPSVTKPVDEPQIGPGTEPSAQTNEEIAIEPVKKTENTVVETRIPESAIKKEKKKEPQVAKTRNYNPKEDVMLNPPQPDCELVFDGIDNFTGKGKKETPRMVFFRHTDDFMRPSMKDKDYIVCEAWATWVQGGFYFLNLVFTIETKDAQRAFGFLDKGSPISFKLLNGRNMIMPNSKTDIGAVDTQKGNTTYRAQLQMDAAGVRNLTESELDVVRVAWSAGYEDYEILDVDFLKNLFKCLDKTTK